MMNNIFEEILKSIENGENADVAAGRIADQIMKEVFDENDEKGADSEVEISIKKEKGNETAEVHLYGTKEELINGFTNLFVVFANDISPDKESAVDLIKMISKHAKKSIKEEIENEIK